MKAIAVAVLAATLGTSARADRLINVPVGRKIAYGAARFEYRSQQGPDRLDRYGVAFGVTTFFEADVYGLSEHGDTDGSFDVMFNLLSPIADLAPGISFGVQDALNVTEAGRRAYGVVSYRTMLSTFDSDQAAEISLGMYVGQRTAPFVGISFPLASFMGILLEHDTYHPAAALEFRPAKDVSLRVGVRGPDTILSAGYLVRF